MPSQSIPSRALSATPPELRGISRSRIIGVAIDPAKTFHKVLIFDFNLDILEGPFEIDTFRTGLERLLEAIKRAKRVRRAQEIVIGLEASGALSWNLSRELSRAFDHVYMLNPLKVATARKGKLLLGQKTDAIDVAVIGDLLLRGEGRLVRQTNQVFLELHERVYWRHHKTHLIGELKQQLIDRFEKVYPGATVAMNGSKPLIADLKRSKLAWGLIEEGLTPQELLRLSPPAVRTRLKPYVGSYSHPSPLRIQVFLKRMLFGTEVLAKTQLTLLKHDLEVLKGLRREMATVEQEMVALVKQTPGRWLLGQIKGLSDLQVASYIGALGDPRHFQSAKEIYSFAGLSPRQHQSGVHTKRTSGITKSGRRILRTTLFQMAQSVTLYEPVFRNYREKLREQRGKGFRTALIATANKLNKTLFALMRDQEPYRRGDAVSRMGLVSPQAGDGVGVSDAA